MARLPPRVRQAMATAGFAAAGSNWAFRRHVLERRGLGYAAFVQQLLSAEDWALWQQQEDEAICCEFTPRGRVSRCLA